MIAIWILLGIAINQIIGYCVLDGIDNEQRHLFNWAKSCPMPGGFTLIVMLWPATAWYWFQQQRKKND